MKTLKRFYIALIALLILTPSAWSQTYSLGTTNLLEGPGSR